MKEEKPRITAVIPAYDAERFLARALRSVLDQTRPPDEVIVVDDGSRDGTAAVARSFGDAARVIRQENAGVSAARNRGVEESTGEWIAFCDADDRWEPRRLEWQVELLARRPDLDWVSGEQTIYFGDWPLQHQGIPHDFAWDGDAVRILQLWAAGGMTGSSSMLLRTELIRKAGGFDPGVAAAEDRDLWLRIARHEPWIGYIPRPLFRYQRENPGSVMVRTLRRGGAQEDPFTNRHWPARTDFDREDTAALERFISRRLGGFVRLALLWGNDARAGVLTAQARRLGIELSVGPERHLALLPATLRRGLSRVRWRTTLLRARLLGRV